MGLVQEVGEGGRQTRVSLVSFYASISGELT